MKNLQPLPPHIQVCPPNFHGRTKQFLPENLSEVSKQLQNIEEYARKHEMKINTHKTKVILFNPCRKMDFEPSIKLGDTLLEYVEKVKLLGITLTSDLKWSDNTNDITGRGFKRLWILRRLKTMGASNRHLVEVYI